ncbi:MAG: iron-sulfur cluster-binding domain-containing protein [Pseudomonadales bacterium]|nr:iron-sulfur cluster-binding domain-containing protein [Pseudomonadales bacterium]
MTNIKSKNPVPKIQTQNLLLELLSRHQETHNIVSFEMAVTTENAKPFRHYPGQAVAIALPLEKGDVFRTFTIASGTSDNGRIVLTVKAGKDADASAYMHRQLRVGDRIKGRGPFGHFSLVHYPKQPLLLIGAGSGLTPMLSCLRWLYHRREVDTDVICIQQASTPSDILCRKELITMNSRIPKLIYIDWVSHLENNEHWSGLKGRISFDKLQAAVPDIAKRTVLCCGPLQFTNTVLSIYKDLGGDENNFLTELFAQESFKKSFAAEDLESESKEFVIELDGNPFTGTNSESIIDAAARSGVIIPTACRAGICGTCKLRVLQGRTAMNHNGGLSTTEEAQGYILGCSTTAKTNLILSSDITD